MVNAGANERLRVVRLYVAVAWDVIFWLIRGKTLSMKNGFLLIMLFCEARVGGKNERVFARDFPTIYLMLICICISFLLVSLIRQKVEI